MTNKESPSAHLLSLVLMAEIERNTLAKIECNTLAIRQKIRTVIEAFLREEDCANPPPLGADPLIVDVSASPDDPGVILISPANERTRQLLMQASGNKEFP